MIAEQVRELPALDDAPVQASSLIRPVVRQLSNWRWAISFSILLTLLLEVPFRMAAAHLQDGAYFVGMFWSPHDAAQYLSAMRQGAASSSWLIVDRFSQEPHDPALMYPLYVSLGKLAALLGISFDNAFLLASAAGRFFLCLSLYAFTAIATLEPGPRRLALVMLALSSGLASVMAVLKFATGLPLPLSSRELNDPELNTFLTFFTAPHLMIGLGLLLIAVRAYASCWEHAGWRRPAGLSLSVLLLGFTNPFSLVPLCVIVGAHALMMTVLRRSIDRTGWAGAIIVAVTSLPFVVYSYVQFTLDPFWGATYGAQNQTLSPPLLDTLAGLGLLIPLALLGLRRFLMPLTPGKILVLLWIGLSLTLMYAPIGIQRRFGLGIHPTLAMVATFGLLMVWRGLSRLRPPFVLLRPFATVGLGQVLFGSSVYLYVLGVNIALPQTVASNEYAPGAGADRSTYQQTSVQAAGNWLAAQIQPNESVMAATLTGNYLAGAVPGRVYVGHWVATSEYTEKKRHAEWFFGGPLDAERRAFLYESAATYVVVGPAERLLGASTYNDASLTPVYDRDDVTVYRVVRTETATSRP